MRKVKDLVVVTGTYQKDGETKKRYMNVGSIMEGESGEFILLNRTFNPAGVANPDNRESVLVSMFDVKPRDNSGEDPVF